MKLHLGCGRNVRAGWVNVDLRQLPGVDVVCDCTKRLPWDDGSIDEVWSENFLEHIPGDDAIHLLNETHRILKPGGLAHHLIPQAGTRVFYQDLTHKSMWIPETFTYLDRSHWRHQTYGRDYFKPWIVEKIDITVPNECLDVYLRKP